MFSSSFLFSDSISFSFHDTLMIRISEKEAPMRLDQLMADHQYARKDIKQLLARRQILVDHLPAQKLSQNIDPGLQQIQIGDQIIQEPRHHYYMLHKPIGAVTAKRDAHHPTVIDLVDPPARVPRPLPSWSPRSRYEWSAPPHR